MQNGNYQTMDSRLLTQDNSGVYNGRISVPMVGNRVQQVSPEDYMTRMLAKPAATQVGTTEASSSSETNTSESVSSFGRLSNTTSHVTTVTRTLLPPKKIGWTHLPVRKVTAERVRDYAIETGGRDRISREFLEEKEAELKQVRKHLMVFARRHIHRFFLEGLKEMNVTNLATMEDIQNYWREHCKEPVAQEIIAHMLYGYFDERVHWEVNLEKEYMRQMNWVYMDRANDSKDKKGCIAKVISEVKVEQTRRIQQAGQKAGVYVSIKRQGPLQREDKNRKRKKGNFYVRTSSEQRTVVNETGDPLTAMFQVASVNLVGLSGDALTSFTTQFLNLVNATQSVWTRNNALQSEVGENDQYEDHSDSDSLSEESN